jgi:hypothetical protein
MNHTPANEMSGIARRLIAGEFRAGPSDDSKGRAAFRVCEKLRRSLSIFVGIAGFRSLLARALVLAKAQNAWLDDLQIDADGTIGFLPGREAQLDTRECAEAGALLIATFLNLLVIFIGKTLTLHLVQDLGTVSPSANDSRSPQKDKS